MPVSPDTISGSYTLAVLDDEEVLARALGDEAVGVEQQRLVVAVIAAASWLARIELT